MSRAIVRVPGSVSALRGRSLELGTAGAGGALLFAALFLGGGSSADRLFWIGSAALVLTGFAGAAALAGLLPLPSLDRTGLAFVLALAGLAAWSGASLEWSVVPDRSWLAFDRGIVYVAFAVLGLLLGTLLGRPVRVVGSVLTVLLTGVLGWALLGKVFPALYTAPPASPVTRLRNPVGYWNALALLADVALVLALWTATPRGRAHALRAFGAVLFYLAVVAVLLTSSRTGVVVGGLAAVAWLALTRERLEGLAVTALAGAPALGVAGFAFTRGGLSSFESHSARVRDGAWFGLLLALGGALVFAAALRLARREQSDPLASGHRQTLARGLGAAVAAAVVVALAGFTISAGGPSDLWSEFTNPVAIEGSGGLGSRSSSGRWAWWGEAWQLFREEPLRGRGAASFAVARRPIRHNPLEVSEPHNTGLQFLSELGIVGFLLGSLAAATALAGAATAVRRSSSRDRLPALALSLALGIYLLHALVDYDWEFVAVTGPVLFVAGVLAATGRPRLVPRRRLVPAGITLVAVLASLYSLGAPWLAGRRVDRAYAALDRDAVGVAIDSARSARRLDPFSYEPYWALAAAALAAGEDRAALLAYERAAVLQPRNSDTWYALGQYQFQTGRFAGACYALDLAYRLDPRGPAGDPSGLLDQVKERLPGCPAPSSR